MYLYSFVFLCVGTLSIVGNSSKLALSSLTSMMLLALYNGLDLYPTAFSTYLIGIMAFSLPLVCLHKPFIKTDSELELNDRDYVMLAGYTGLLAWEVVHMYGWITKQGPSPVLDIVISASFLALIALSGIPKLGRKCA